MNSEAVKYMRSHEGQRFIREFGYLVLDSPIVQYFAWRHASDIKELRAQDQELRRQLGRAPCLQWAMPPGTYRYIDVNDIDQEELMSDEILSRFHLKPYAIRSFAAKNGRVVLYYVSDNYLVMAIEKD